MQNERATKVLKPYMDWPFLTLKEEVEGGSCN